MNKMRAMKNKLKKYRKWKSNWIIIGNPVGLIPKNRRWYQFGLPCSSFWPSSYPEGSRRQEFCNSYR